MASNAGDAGTEHAGILTTLGLAFSRWSTRWFPDALVFALIAIILVFFGALLCGESPGAVAVAGGKSFWALSGFTMQMVMVVIGGYVVAMSRPVRRLIDRLAAIPRAPKAAVAYIALFSMASSLLSWGMSLIFSAQLVRAIARRLPGLDYRAAGAAAYLGLGVTWALGLSSSAAMLMATRSALPPALLEAVGVIPLSDTLFTWQNAVLALVMLVTATIVAYASAPDGDMAVTAADLGVSLDEEGLDVESPQAPGERLEHSPLLALFVGVLLLYYVVVTLIDSPVGIIGVLDLNIYNLLFLVIGLLLHWRPISFLRAVKQSVPATGGVLIQFPFYAVVFGMIVNTQLSHRITEFFISVASGKVYPLLVAIYSSALGVFIPSGEVNG